MSIEQGFFSKDENIQTMKNFIGKFESTVLLTSDKFEIQRNNHILFIIKNMISNPEEWNNSCQFNIKNIGEEFIRSISDYHIKSQKKEIDFIFSDCYRFIFEYYLSVSQELPKYHKVEQFAYNNIDNFESVVKEQIKYTQNNMSISIFKTLINSTEMGSIKEFDEKYGHVEAQHEKLEKLLETKEKRIDILESRLNEYKKSFNFVVLVEGFDKLFQEKEKEKNKLRWGLVILGIIALIPIILEIGYIYITGIDKITNKLIVITIPTISLVGVLIYYFRVLLSNYKSVKSQILQIELRKTLCAFIQDYAKYAKEIKANNPSSLEKFENVIFSSLVSNDDAIPSTFDSLDQLSKVIKSIKG